MAAARAALLGPDDPPPFEIVNRDGAARAVLICDHAGRAIPKALGTLGLDEAALWRHIAWDIGIADVTRMLARSLDAPAVLGSYSRLVIDCNRRLGDPTSIAQESDGVEVPGNRGLGPAEREARAEACFVPYHAAIAGLIEGRRRAGIQLALVSMHSFTPVMNGFERPWHVGILWNRDGRLPKPLMARLAAEPGICVGDNEPYTGRDEHGYSIYVHGQDLGLPHVLIELRQDLIDTRHGAEEWAERLGRILAELLADEGLYRAEQD
ncbi:MAG: N-formylglutamate amidohydrolase [Alphaproteobacteria bacterium]|nr:MAG: N-formylglutamate amidohydrolase [Alphaproteobacteria bacterium]